MEGMERHGGRGQDWGLGARCVLGVQGRQRRAKHFLQQTTHGGCTLRLWSHLSVFGHGFRAGLHARRGACVGMRGRRTAKAVPSEQV